MSEVAEAPTTAAAPPRSVRRRPVRRGTSLFANGEPMVWLTGGALAICVLMIAGLLALVVWPGVRTFWPVDVVQVATVQGKSWLGEVTSIESYRPGEQVFDALPADAAAAARSKVAAGEGVAERTLLRTENFELTGTHYTWISDFEVVSQSLPEWALVIERVENGRFYGLPRAMRVDGATVAGDPRAVVEALGADLPAVHDRLERRRRLKTEDIGRISDELEEARLAARAAEIEHGKQSDTWLRANDRFVAVEQDTQREFQRISSEIAALERENARHELVVDPGDGGEHVIPLAQIVRAYPANRLTFGDALGVYGSRVAEFLGGEPRESNTEGGVMPAIFGTVAMTLIMSLLVVPFGVLAALYLREYAKPGPIVSFVRIAINNLAGVPSIVFGVFGLGFFCYVVGASVDQLLYAERLPNPTFGTGGLLWASLTLALLTLPVVIVPTEEALAAVPSSMREGSYACGATKWQTIRRIVLPRALPGIMTGMILAIARGAGEVAPLMLVGAVKLAPELPVDGEFPYVHAARSFMHLGFHIYDLGFQSPNSEAAKPMVYTTTLLLIGLVVLLNVIAIAVRARLRRRFQGAHV